MVSFRGQFELVSHHIGLPGGVSFSFSGEHPRHFYVGVPPGWKPPSPWGSVRTSEKKIRSHYSTFLFSVALALRKANFLAQILALNSPLQCCQPSIAWISDDYFESFPPFSNTTRSNRLKFRLFPTTPPFHTHTHTHTLKKYYSQSRYQSTSTSTSTLLYEKSASPQRRTNEWCRISQL